MSKKKVTICDKCKGQIGKGQPYYDVNCLKYYEDSEIETEILKRGDYCEECLRIEMKRVLKI